MTDQQTTILEERYGTKRTSRRNRIIGVIVAVVAVGAGILFLATGGLPSADQSTESRDMAHQIVDDANVSLTFQVTAPSNAPVACAIEALNPSYAVVGWKVLELPISDDRTRNFTEDLVTTNRATTVTVRECWVVESADER